MDRFDGLLWIGLLLLAIGCALIFLPLGLIAGGAGCIAIAVIGARAEARTLGPAPKAAPVPPKDQA